MHTAIGNLQKCNDTYLEVGDSQNQLTVSQNLCYLYFMSGRLHESAAGYEGIESQISDIGEQVRLIHYEMSAIPQALLGDIKTARKTIAKAKPFLDSYPRERAIYFENLGLINLLDGKYTVAEKELKKGLKLSLEIAPESALVSQIKRLFGDLYVATEQWDKAKQFTNEALEVAEKIGQRIEIAACYRIFALLEQHHNHDDKARDLRAVEILTSLGPSSDRSFLTARP